MVNSLILHINKACPTTKLSNRKYFVRKEHRSFVNIYHLIALYFDMIMFTLQYRLRKSEIKFPI